MNRIPALEELAIVAGLGVVVTALLSKLRLPTVAGLLAAGALLGPFGLGLVKDVGAIEGLAEVGVVLLLFTIGLEFSLERLRHIFRRLALGGSVQVGATILATAGVATAIGVAPGPAVFFGFVVAMSSTAIVLRALRDRSELDAPHGRFVVGTLIFQDLCVVPMVLLIPVLASGASAGAAATQIGYALGKAGLVVLGTLFVAKMVVPRALRWVDASRSREVFLLAIIAICVGTAWLTSMVGLSLALGAFLGGMVVADTEFQHRAMGDMIPLRDAFVSIFFISLGMLFNVGSVAAHPVVVGLWLLGFVGAKTVVAMIAAALMRFPPRAVWLAGIGLGQFGEFGFVLLKQGEAKGLTTPDAAGALLAAGIVSMFLTPILIRLAPHIKAGERLLSPLSKMLGVRGLESDAAVAERLARHVVVVGYGIAGKLVARALAACAQPYAVLEMNAETVRRAKESGVPVYYADATSEDALAAANIAAARVAVLLINDPEAAVRVVDTVHRVAPAVPVVIRTRYHAERERLLGLGAVDVVAEEVEASVEVLARLLRRLEIPRNVIVGQIREARDAMQTSSRKITLPRTTLLDHRDLGDLKIESVLVTDGSRALGRNSVELDVRRKTGALVVAIRRGDRLLEQPDPSEAFATGDVIYLVGSNAAIRTAIDLLDQDSGAEPA
ncbi:MAG: cation:proton antiporter [Deltaproteobacteria bacterium]|nr:cation:proton antiporter [Deltaproteobacteria bacterium]